MKKSNGFSLLELLFALAIIAMFLSLVLPHYGQATATATQSVALANAKEVARYANILRSLGVDIGKNPTEIISTLRKGVRLDGAIIMLRYDPSMDSQVAKLLAISDSNGGEVYISP